MEGWDVEFGGEKCMRHRKWVWKKQAVNKKGWTWSRSETINTAGISHSDINSIIGTTL